MLQLLRWNSNKYYILLVCVCSLRYPACNAHAPYCRLWSVRLQCIFPLYRKVFGGKKILNSKCEFLFSLQKFCQKNIYNSNEEFSEKLPKIYKGLHVNYALFLSDFNVTLIFLEDFRKKTPLKYRISLKIFPMLAALFHADGQTD